MGKKIAFVGGLFLLLFSCCQKTVTESKLKAKHFFDLAGYFDDELQRLKEIGKVVKKVVISNDKQEEKVLDSIDFRRELNAFIESDINRPAWSDKYVVDSTFNERRELTNLSFVTTDDKLKTQRIDVRFIESKVSNIIIENGAKSSLALFDQVLTYNPSLGYSIDSYQKVAMSEPRKIKIEVKFLE